MSFFYEALVYVICTTTYYIKPSQSYSTEKQDECSRIGMSKRDKILSYVACIKTVITLKTTHILPKICFSVNISKFMSQRLKRHPVLRDKNGWFYCTKFC